MCLFSAKCVLFRLHSPTTYVLSLHVHHSPTTYVLSLHAHHSPTTYVLSLHVHHAPTTYVLSLHVHHSPTTYVLSLHVHNSPTTYVLSLHVHHSLSQCYLRPENPVHWIMSIRNHIKLTSKYQLVISERPLTLTPFLSCSIVPEISYLLRTLANTKHHAVFERRKTYLVTNHINISQHTWGK